MKLFLRRLFVLARGLLLAGGSCALLYAALQFSPWPWRAYKHLSGLPAPDPGHPALILLMGGSGIPGESGLMRTFYAAEAARRHPEAGVLVAMPLDAAESESSRAYLDELRLRGIDSGRLQILSGGRNTREQALRLAEFTRGGTEPPRILIVTDPEHVRRTAACIRKAFAEQQRAAALDALPAFPLSIDDPLPWRAAELDAPGAGPAVRAAVPDIGASLYLRYNVWANLEYTHDALRELAALGYYRLRGWI